MAQAGTARQTDDATGHDKLYMENTLLRVSGALFCHDAKRAPTHTGEIELNRGIADNTFRSVPIRVSVKLARWLIRCSSR